MDIIIDFESGSFSKTALATKHGVPKSSLTRILHDKDKLRDAFETSRFGPQRKRLRHGDHEELENEDALEKQEVIEQCALRDITLDFDEYVQVDSGVATCPDNTVQSIVDEVCDEEEEEELEDSEEPWPAKLLVWKKKNVATMSQLLQVAQALLACAQPVTGLREGYVRLAARPLAFSILKTIRRDFVDALPLPARLKAYLNTPHYYSEELADSVALGDGGLAIQSQEPQSGVRQQGPFSPS
ncbi:hypothetical protein HPB50_013173 [Hyalomma asiaticum]|uniref:Uncharacterized protein n=1 Tax=Hyalomma asiaticum TaxID=266040 RepID=A0ACB7S686_HYAAI|nr:hypothetical protein HPB50_013173 [Hyalomma asiaticum]